MENKNLKQTGQCSLFSTLDEMLNPKHPLYKLANTFPWETVTSEFSKYYSHTGRPAKAIRLMCSLLLLKHIYNLGDETVVAAWIQNPYYQYFSGEETFQWNMPCNPTDLVHFRKRIGTKGLELLFSLSAKIHGRKAQEGNLVADTTVMEKNITYPTDVKLYRKVILFCWRIADKDSIKLRQRYSRTIRNLMLQQRFRNHPKNYKKAHKAQRKIKTIAGRLLREIHRNLTSCQCDKYREQLLNCQRILDQQKKDKNKIYSLHEPQVYCISKGKEHKKYEYGCKASILSTKNSGIIVGACSYSENKYDGHTLHKALVQHRALFDKDAKEVIADRGYRGKSRVGETKITIPTKPSKSDSPYVKRTIRLKFRRRAAIEPIIGHLKTDNRLSRNYHKGEFGDQINVLLAAIGFNLRKWLRDFLHLFGCCKIMTLFKIEERLRALQHYSSSNCVEYSFGFARIWKLLLLQKMSF